MENLILDVKTPHHDTPIRLKASVTQNFNEANTVYPAGLGCHFRWVAGLGLHPDYSAAGIQYGSEKMQKLTTWFDKEYRVPQEDSSRLFAEMVKTFGKLREQAENSFGPTPAGTPKGPTFVVMSDNINSYTPEFPKNSGLHQVAKVANGFKTSDFVQYLVREQVGIVMGSPVGRNHWHQNNENFSLVQAWFWIPPWHAGFTVPGSHFISGIQQQPNWDQWYSGIRQTCSGMKDRTDKDIDTRMWKNGKRNSHLEIMGKGNEAC